MPCQFVLCIIVLFLCKPIQIFVGERMPGQYIAGSRTSVLLVEDEAAVRKVMKARLQIEGYSVVEAENATMAIRAFEAEAPFDLILTDIVMPGGLQGTGLVKALREKDPSVKAIFMSGYPNEAAIHGNGLRPEDVKLMKPVSKDDLLRALKRVLGASPDRKDR